MPLFPALAVVPVTVHDTAVVGFHVLRLELLCGAAVVPEPFLSCGVFGEVSAIVVHRIGLLRRWKKGQSLRAGDSVLAAMRACAVMVLCVRGAARWCRSITAQLARKSKPKPIYI